MSGPLSGYDSLGDAYSRPDLVHNIATIRALASICYDDFQVGLFIEDLLHSTVIATFGWDWPCGGLRLFVVFIVVVEI